MGSVCVDNSIWYAVADAGDAHSPVARSLLEQHAGALVTSDLVLAELWNLLNGRADHRVANQVVAAIASGIARVECALDRDHLRSRRTASGRRRHLAEVLDQLDAVAEGILGIDLVLAVHRLRIADYDSCCPQTLH